MFIRQALGRRNLRIAAGIITAAIAARPSSALATVKTWDATAGNGVVNNGSGTWSTGTSTWTTDGGTTNVAWVDNDDAVFGGATTVGAAGTITLSGNNSVSSLTFNAVPSGNFLITGAQRLELGTAATAITQNSSSAVTIDPGLGIRAGTINTTLTLGGNGSGAVTINDALFQQGFTLAVTKSGSSNFILSSASNNYSGATNISGGTLTVNGTVAGTGAFNVNSTGKLAGTGTISKTTTINNGGTLSPAGDGTNSNVGTINTNAHNWESGSTYYWEIKDATAAAGSGFDTLNVNGALSVNATSGSPLTIKVVSHGAVSNFTASQVWNWTIATASSLSGFAGNKFLLDVSDFVDDNPLADPALFSVTSSGNSIRVTYTPEPGATLLAGAGGAMALLRRRRRHL